MGVSHLDPAARGRPAWNAGKQVGAKRALKPRQIWAIRFFGCDLVKTKIGTLVAGSDIRMRSMVIQQKNGRPVQFEITTDARASLLAWLVRRGGTVGDFAFPNRVTRTAI